MSHQLLQAGLPIFSSSIGVYHRPIVSFGNPSGVMGLGRMECFSNNLWLDMVGVVTPS